MKKNSGGWKTAMAYAAMSSEKAERMVGTINAQIRITFLYSPLELDKALGHAAFEYCCEKTWHDYSPFELFYGK